MSDLKEVMLYVCQQYPHKHELSKARVAKMVYLADWRSAILRRRQITPLRWKFNHYGPYLDDIVETASRSPEFTVHTTTNMYGSPKQLIEATSTSRPARLPDDEKAIIDHVIHETERLYFNDFLKLVYSTYPILTEPRQAELDLVKLAGDYQALQASLQQ